MYIHLHNMYIHIHNMYVCTYVRTYIHTHTCIHTYIHIHTHTYIHTYTYIRTHLTGGSENCNLGERGELTVLPVADKEEL